MFQKLLRLMKKERLNTKASRQNNFHFGEKPNGFSLVEVILSVAVFSLVVTVLMGAFFYGQESTVLAGKRARAVYYCEEALEAARNIRDFGFDSLINGIHGLQISENIWQFSGESDALGEFSRELVISSVDDKTKQAVCNVSWEQTLQRQGLVSLLTYFTNWQETVSVADCFTFCQGKGYASGICRKDSQQCKKNGEIYEVGGDIYCTSGKNVDICCCFSESVDTTAPSAITNLTLAGATNNSIDLEWTAPGDDINIGTAASYDVRYSTALITEINWDTAMEMIGEPAPSVAGSLESMTVSGLSADTTYYFAIKTSDEAQNISDLSNVPSLATTGGGAITSCVEYCQFLEYLTGNCRKNSRQCNANGEIYEAGGDVYCTGGKSAGICCCD